MAITILSILDLHTPLGLGFGDTSFHIFYVEAEKIVTSTQNRNTGGVSNTIDNSLSDSKGIDTWITSAYQTGQYNSTLDNDKYSYRNIAFVNDLQLLVLKEYDSIDEFYEATGITVSATFAVLSQAAGYPISPQYIKDIT